MGAEVSCMVYILALLLFITGILLFIKLRQEDKKSIVLRMNDRYPNMNEYVVAIKYELERQGKDVVYNGKGNFVIDGKYYRIGERKKIITDGESMQLTVLKYLKSS